MSKIKALQYTPIGVLFLLMIWFLMDFRLIKVKIIDDMEDYPYWI